MNFIRRWGNETFFRGQPSGKAPLFFSFPVEADFHRPGERESLGGDGKLRNSYEIKIMV
jgi:hypothetical protein